MPRARLQAILDNVLDGIITIDDPRHHRFDQCGGSRRKMFGYMK